MTNKIANMAKLKEAMLGNSPLAQKLNAGSGLPGYSKGGPVKKDGYLTDKKGKPYARVHKGEKVVPASTKTAQRKPTEEELLALIPGRERAMKDTRSKEQLIKAIHEDRRKMHKRRNLGTAATGVGLASTLGSFIPKSPAAQLALFGTGTAAALAGLGLSASSRGKAMDLRASKQALIRRIREEGTKKTASIDFAVGIRIASDTLYNSYMDKTASNPMFLARLGKMISGAATKATPYVGAGWSKLKDGGRMLAEGIEGGARSARDTLLKKFPEQGKQFAALLERNPELAKTLASAKKNWRPLAGGTALGGAIMAGD